MSERYEIGQIRKIDEDMPMTSALTGEIVKTYKKRDGVYCISKRIFCIS